MRIRLDVNGRTYDLDAPPLRRLLDLLREDLGLTGTKEGCGEGECGACAVHLNDELVNACLVPAVQADGAQVRTIEGLGSGAELDPVQQAFIEEGASQCGFCIPGMVMAARALLDSDPRPDRARIREELAGNLCRCTGYERIFRAVERAAEHASGVRSSSGRPAKGVRSGPASTPSAGAGRPAEQTMEAYRPATLADALDFLARAGSDVTLVAGATDLLTSVRLGFAPGGPIVDLLRLAELAGIARHDGWIEIGALTRLSEVARSALLRAALPALAEAARLFGAPAIRNRATLGGNLVTASPAADTPPVLLALNSLLVLQRRGERREVPMTSFYKSYRRTVLEPGELVTHVRIPVPPEGSAAAFYKVGTRRAQSIAKVSLAASSLRGTDRALRGVRLAAGSVAPIPTLLTKTMALLEGRVPDPALIEAAARQAGHEVQPIDDVRSTERYRRAVTANLVRRYLEDQAGD